MIPETPELAAESQRALGVTRLDRPALGRPTRAFRLAGSAASLRGASGARHPRNLADWLERVIAPARLALGEEAARAAQAEGRAMTLEQAVSYSLEDAEDK